MAQNDLVISPVSGKADMKAFIDLPWRLYANDPNWVPPLKAEVKAMAALREPVEIAVFGDQKQYLHYKDSRVFTELQEVMDGIIRSFISETVMSTAAVPVIARRSTVPSTT